MDVHSLEIGNKQVTQPLITIQLNRSANTASPNRDVSSMLNCIRVISVSNIHLINQLIALKKKNSITYICIISKIILLV